MPRLPATASPTSLSLWTIAGAVLLAAVCVALPSRAWGQGPTLAVEDTLHTAVPEVLVRAPRVTLDEILNRVARGEARRDSQIADQTYIATVRMIGNTSDAKREPKLLEERVWRVYKKRPDRSRAIELRHYEAKQEKERAKAEVEVNFGSDMSEEIVNFAFRPESRRNFRFKIVGRDLVGNHIIYRIEFTPRSNLGAGEPSGTVWVDTNEFVIVREELRFERSPAPLLIRGLDRMVIERRKVDGHWVLHRALARLKTTIPLPRVGSSFDFALAFDQYLINRGIDDAIFEPATKGKR